MPPQNFYTSQKQISGHAPDLLRFGRVLGLGLDWSGGEVKPKFHYADFPMKLLRTEKF